MDPVQGNSKSKGVVYEASSQKLCLVSLGPEHNNGMKNPGNRIKSKVVSHIWALKENGTDHEVNNLQLYHEIVETFSKRKVFYNVQKSKQHS